MIGKPGPFQIIENESLDFPLEPPRRRYSCPRYDTCLNLAAALNWDSFTCRGCSGEANQALFWRARQEFRKDGVVRKICDEIPDAEFITNEPAIAAVDSKVVQLADRRQNRAS